MYKHFFALSLFMPITYQRLIMMFLNNQKVIFAYFIQSANFSFDTKVSSNHFDQYLLFLLFTGNCDFNAVSELRGLKSRLEELESDLKDRDEEIKSLKDTSSQLKAVNGEDSDIVKVILVKNRRICHEIARMAKKINIRCKKFPPKTKVTRGSYDL